MSVYDKYKAVIGLEIHAQLSTEAKAFCSDSAAYGGAPNTQVSPISLGHPGTLPKLNKRQVEFAVKMGLACGSDIRRHNKFARKNYFYPDLPKGYQISQFDTPICDGGIVIIKGEDGKEKAIRLIRIHMEEDSGKSTHDLDPYFSLVDLNRAGVPLIEIVTEPDIASSQEAYNYLTEVRKLVRYLGICDGNMEEGSLRCDANVSVMLKEATDFGQRTELKNMNSIRNVQRAIEAEMIRQIDIIEGGAKVDQNTMRYDPVKDVTFVMRTKEDAHDYRYFTEPDLPPLTITEDYIAEINKMMPALPRELYLKYSQELGLSEYDAGVLTDDKDIALFFEEVISNTKAYKSAANWIQGAVKGYLNENGIHLSESGIKAKHIVELIELVDGGKISSSSANSNLFPEVIKQPSKSVASLAEELNLIQDMAEDDISGYIEEVIAAFPDKVAAYKAGNKNLLGMFMGQVMKKSGGKADPKKTNELIRQALEN
jgi:aspartyl-tRNA(Asn)/glutamyl-tRNA(Gln) amidotransferase subunit B